MKPDKQILNHIGRSLTITSVIILMMLLCVMFLSALGLVTDQEIIEFFGR
jgi:hypothetical protein